MMQIDWWTLLLQAINFLVLVWLLWRFLYRPVREIVEKRRQVAEQALTEAVDSKDQAEAARRRFEEDRASLAEERQKMLRQVHTDLEKERQAALRQARAQAEEMLEDARRSIARERDETSAEIRAQVAEIAVDLAADILRKTGTTIPTAALLDQFERRLDGLPDDERERLEKDMAAAGGYLEVVTAAPLSAEEQAQWRERLDACLSHRDKIRFAPDPEILGGAALQFPHARLSLTWTDQLRNAEELLTKDTVEPDEAAS